MKIGIFGGCFNPPHNMHKNIALRLIEDNYLDKVIFVPTSNYYNKRNLINDEERYKLIKLMIQGNDNLEVSKYEFGKLTYTYQTLEHFQKKYEDDEIYFICGSDNLAEIDTWREYEIILSNFKILVIKRGNDDLGEIMKKYKKYENNIIIANIEEDVLSSTFIRNMLKDGKFELIKDKIDKNVYLYIMKEKLYY